jgi:hypothetical protein
MYQNGWVALCAQQRGGVLTSPCQSVYEIPRRCPSPNLERDEDRVAEQIGSRGEVEGAEGRGAWDGGSVRMACSSE